MTPKLLSDEELARLQSLVEQSSPLYAPDDQALMSHILALREYTHWQPMETANSCTEEMWAVIRYEVTELGSRMGSGSAGEVVYQVAKCHEGGGWTGILGDQAFRPTGWLRLEPSLGDDTK